MLGGVDARVEARESSSNEMMTEFHRSGTHWRPRSALLQFRAVLYMACVDAVAIFIGFMCAAIPRYSMSIDTGWLVFALVLTPLYILIASSLDAYDTANLQDPFRAIRRGLHALVLAVGCVILAVFYLKSGTIFSRFTIGFGSALSTLFIGVGRYFFVRHLDTIVGGNPFSSILLCDRGAPIPPGNFSMVMAAESYFDPEEHDPHMYDRLATLIASADRVVVTCAPERRMAWAQALRGTNVQSEIVVPELAALSPLGLGLNRDVPTIVVAAGPLNLMDRIVKRTFDLIVAVFALLGLLPILLATAVAVRFNSSGPVLFKQVRIGRGNQLFRMYKFRSMHVRQLDDAGHRSTARDDDRVTSVGRFIRRTSIDELPQLINVLKGDMSIVGPRPHALGSRAADKLFWEVDQRYWNRHAAKPGLTGLAQIRGFRGATLVEDDLKNRLKADLEYLENWSIWRDLKIIFLTVRVIFHRNAF
jgi:lipopolysaccharide/colanic/teichoic acid biosynthesis glycosyltransferase